MYIETKNLELLYRDEWVRIPDRLFTFSKNIRWDGPADLNHLYFQTLFGLNKNYKGDVLWGGISICRMNFQQNLKFRKSHSLVFDWGGLLSNQTLIDNILLPTKFHGENTIDLEKEVRSFFSLLDYTHFLDKRPCLVPMNLRKIACILRSSILRPKVLFIEDISLGLDEKDLYPLQFYLSEHVICLYYYDSLAKFSYLSTDKMEVIDEVIGEKAS